MTDITAVFSEDAVLSGTAGSLEELVQAFVELAIAGLGAGNLPWVVLTEVASLSPNTAYAVSGLSLLTLALPAATPDSRLILYAYSAAGWRLQQAAPTDVIQIGDSFTSVGPSGAVRSLGQGSCVELVRLSERWVGNVLQGHVEVL